MSILGQIKEAIGIDSSYEYEYECESCGETFGSNQEPDSYWLSCSNCGSEKVELQTEIS